MASISPTTPPGLDKIQGLREQIIANASILFPQIMAVNTATEPAKIFQVITTRENGSSRALLLHGEGNAKQIAAKGPVSISGGGGEAERALSGLLNVTSEALGWYSSTLLGEVENSEEVAGGGEVDLGMVEEGFHFVAVERWAEKH